MSSTRKRRVNSPEKNDANEAKEGKKLVVGRVLNKPRSRLLWMSPVSSQSPIVKLIIYSAAIFLFPLVAYYGTQQMEYFQGRNGTTLSALCSVAIVQIVLVLFVLEAMSEDDQTVESRGKNE